MLQVHSGCISQIEVLGSLNSCKKFSNFQKVPSTDVRFKCVSTADNNLVEPGVYEGGNSIWKATFDLCNFLNKNPNYIKGDVLELGCGHGLPGIYCLVKLSNNPKRRIIFQDFNKFVLLNSTIPNIYHTLYQYYSSKQVKEIILKQCIFFYGDWKELANLIPERIPKLNCRLILASECLYNETYYTSIMTCIKNCSNRKTKCLLATKRLYFGVGGGKFVFEEFIEKYKIQHNSKMILYCVDTVIDYKSSIRDILELSKIS